MQNEKAMPFHKGIYILPNLLTSASIFAAVLAIIWTAQGAYEGASVAILFAALMDGLDGKVARLTNSSSEFGVQYDSLADLVAFGVAPGFLMFQWQIANFGRVGLVITFLYVTCGALRLARFNIAGSGGSKKFFTGLPIPAAGCTIALLALFSPMLPDWIWPAMPYLCLALTFLLAVVMVSRIRYFAFKEYGFLKVHPFSSMVTVMLLFTCIAAQPKLLGFVIILGYLLSGPVYTFIFMPRRMHLLGEPLKPAKKDGQAAQGAGGADTSASEKDKI